MMGGSDQPRADQHAWSHGASDIHSVCRDLAQALNGYSPARHQMVNELSRALLAHQGDEAALARIAVLTDCCTYFSRIGRSEHGLEQGEAARRLARKTGHRHLERLASDALTTAYADSAQFVLSCDRLHRALVLAQELKHPLAECSAMVKTVELFKAMGLYRDALSIVSQVLTYRIDTVDGYRVRFAAVLHGLGCAHRLRDEPSALRLLNDGAYLLLRPEIEPLMRARFEHDRILYLLSMQDVETADGLIQHAQARFAASADRRVRLLLEIAAALVDCACTQALRRSAGRRRLRELYGQSKQTGLHHDEVLRALVQAHLPSTKERTIGEARLVYAKELVEHTASVKRAQFERHAGFHGRLSRGRAGDAPEFEGLETGMLGSVGALRRSLRTRAYCVAENWALVAEFFDDESGHHCFRVGELAGLLAREIGQEALFCARIELAARLHDIGKAALSDSILLKRGPLEPHEWIATREHTRVGAEMLQRSDDAVLQMAARIASAHHEWWNGRGYPARLAGCAIALEARICALADVYDSLTHERAYKGPWNHRMAVEAIIAAKGTHFDPDLVRPFLKVLERYVSQRPRLEGDPAAPGHGNDLLRSRQRLLERMRSKTV